MGGRSNLIYTPRFLDYRLSDAHPLTPVRLALTFDLIQELGLVAPEELVEPAPATREELLLAHDPAYVEVLELAGQTGKPPRGAYRFNLGTEDNPVFKGMHEAGSLIVGGTLTAARLVMEGRADHAFNMAGGLHHAMRDKASGFCVYNDISVAIAYLRKAYGARVAYIDTDGHHGDGVQWAFYQDPEVLTISFHESGRYLFPGTGGIDERGDGAGYGYKVNVPFEPYSDDSSWLAAFRALVPLVVRAFRPDIIVSQNGCDGHALDPLTDLCLTTRSLVEVPRMVHELAHEVCRGRWLALGGGGYDAWRVVPRAWTLLWSVIAGRPIPEAIPSPWLEKWQKNSPVELPLFMQDNPADYPPAPRQQEIAERNRRILSRVLEQCTYILETY